MIWLLEGFFGWKWKRVYLQVYSDSEVAWFNERGDRKALGKVVLKVGVQNTKNKCSQ